MKLKVNSGEASYNTSALNDYVSIDITFEMPYSDTNYIVWGYGTDGYQHLTDVSNKRIDGCTLLFRNTSASTTNRKIVWQSIGQ